MKQELIKVTKRLVGFKTVTGNKNELDKSYTFVKKYLSHLNIGEYVNNGYKSLAISNVSLKEKKYDLILHGHMDVVTVASKVEFVPKVKDGNIYGRGALDMKGGLACFMVLMKNLKNKKTKLKVLLLITSDEEIGGENGTKYLLSKIGYQGDFFITAEGEKDYFLKTEQKGVFMFKLIATGRGDHSAYTWKGENAIVKLFAVYKQIEKLFPFPADSKDHWYSTINLGLIKGGIMKSSIPDMAEAELDIRYCGKNFTAKKIEDSIRKIVKKFKGVKYKVLFNTPLMKASNDEPQIKLMNEVAKKVLGSKNDLFFKNHGTNDARFASDIGIPAIGFGPVGNNYHIKNEYVIIKSLVDYYSIIVEFISLFEKHK